MVGLHKDLLNALYKGKATIVSDGSYEPHTKLAMAAWTVHVNDDLYINVVTDPVKG